MEQAAAAQAATLARACGQAVVYSRGSESVQLRHAIRCKPDFLAVTTAGIVRTSQAWDWIVLPAELVLSAGQVTPREGDRITETTAAGDVTHEVMPTDPAGLAYDVDPQQTRFRIHTRTVTRS